MESIIMPTKYCYFCGGTFGLDSHHIFGGPDRPVSEKYGLKVWLCRTHHRLVHDHPNDMLDAELKELGQTYFEKMYGTREDFIKKFRRSYL